MTCLPLGCEVFEGMDHSLHFLFEPEYLFNTFHMAGTQLVFIE